MDSIKSQELQKFCDYVRENYLPAYESIVERDIPEQYREQWHTVRPYTISAMRRALNSAMQRAVEMLLLQYNNQTIPNPGEDSVGLNQIHQDNTALAPDATTIVTSSRQPVHAEFLADAGNSSLIHGSMEITMDPTGGFPELFPTYSMDVAHQSMAMGLVNDFERIPSQRAIDAFPAWRYWLVETQRGS